MIVLFVVNGRVVGSPEYEELRREALKELNKQWRKEKEKIEKELFYGKNENSTSA